MLVAGLRGVATALRVRASAALSRSVVSVGSSASVARRSVLLRASSSSPSPSSSWLLGRRRSAVSSSSLVSGVLLAASASGASLVSADGGGASPRVLDVCASAELLDGDMKEVQLEGGVRLLVVRVGGVVSCVSGTCPHRGAALVNGLLVGQQVLCPLHNAAFDVRSGELLGAPAIEALATYEAFEENGRVRVRVPEKLPRGPLMSYAKRDPADARTVVLVGGGAAAFAAAETLRAEGYTGRIVMITESPHGPVDRTMLSKSLGLPLAKTQLQPEDFYATLGVEIMTSTTVKSLDHAQKAVVLADGRRIRFDKALLATGATPRVLRSPGSELKNVFTLRTPADSAAIAASVANGKRFVVIGSSFIGMETASALRSQFDAQVHVVSLDKPFERVLGTAVGGALQGLAERNGVKFSIGRSIKELRPNAAGDAVGAVVLDNGDVLECDGVVVGVGVVPATEYVSGESGWKQADGSVKVDTFLHAGNDVYAAGDIARYPYFVTGTAIRVEHWNVALNQGRTAAHNMFHSAPTPYSEVPFFNTRMWNNGLQYAGHCPEGFDEVILEGDVQALKFVAYYCKAGRVAAVASMNTGPNGVAASQAIAGGVMPSAASLRAGQADSKTIREAVRKLPRASCPCGRTAGDCSPRARGGCCGGSGSGGCGCSSSRAGAPSSPAQAK